MEGREEGGGGLLGSNEHITYTSLGSRKNVCIADNSLVILNSTEMKENVTDSSNHLVVLVQGLKPLLLCAHPIMATFCLGQYCSVPSISFIVKIA